MTQMLKSVDEKPDGKIKEALRASIADAHRYWAPLKFQGEYPGDGFGINYIRPQDVNINTTYSSWTLSITSSWADWIATTADKNIYLIVCGIFDWSVKPEVCEIQSFANGQDLPILNVETIKVYDEPLGYFPKPYVIKPDGYYKVQAIAPAAQTEYLGLLGWTLGKRVFLITQ